MLKNNFIPLSPLITTLGVMLTFSLVIERVLTLIAWMIDRLFIIRASTEWDALASQKEKMEQAKQAKEEADILDDQSDIPYDPINNQSEIDTNPTKTEAESTFEIKAFASANPVKVVKEYWLQILGTLVAIVLCYYRKFSVWIFIDHLQRLGTSFNPLNIVDEPVWHFVVTGVLIGAGSKPVNFLMKFLLNRKILVSRKESQLQPAMSTSVPEIESIGKKEGVMPLATIPRAPQTIEDLLGFSYNGGYRPERLEHTHLFPRAVDLIVYHHTAMHSDAPFDAVVRAYEQKGWLTGFHAVVMPDGTIHPFCRWDRFGNHAYHYNTRSLGLAFHGNFESNPVIPFANTKGDYGLNYPTQNQLIAGAKIIALWTLLYNIDTAFPKEATPDLKGIIPHDLIAAKTCPGNNFPQKSFEKFVAEYVNLWKANTSFLNALERFKALPMV
jgi:hypothetical protein